MDWLVYGAVGFLILSLGGLGYFTIWLLVKETHHDAQTAKKTFLTMVKVFNTMKHIIYSTRKDFLDLKTEIHMQKSDSSRLVEWLVKEEKRREEDRITFIKAMKLEERETEIIEISKNLRLLTTKKK